MKTRTDARTLALMARVARVREIQAKQALAQAIERKGAQQARTHEARMRVERSGTALQGALSGPAIDLVRLPLLQELSMHVQAMLASEYEHLAEGGWQVAEQAGVAGKRARQRERLDEETATTVERLRRAHEARQLESATEAWLVRRHAEAP